MSHNFNLRTHVKKIEAMYETPRVKVKVERGLNLNPHAQASISLFYLRA